MRQEKKPLRTLDEAELGKVVGGQVCTPDDPNGDGVIDDGELEDMMKRANNIPV